MQMIYDWLKKANRKELFSAFYSLNELKLREIPEKSVTVEAILEYMEQRFNEFVDGLLAKTPVFGSNVCVFSPPVPFTEDASQVAVYHMDELLNGDKRPIRYGILLCPWDTVLGYFVGETEHTCENKIDFLAAVLNQMAFFGYEETTQIQEKEKLDKTIQDVCSGSGKFYSADEVFEQLGIKRKPTDHKEKELTQNLLKAQQELMTYVVDREISELKKLLKK